MAKRPVNPRKKVSAARKRVMAQSYSNMPKPLSKSRMKYGGKMSKKNMM